MSEKRRRLNAGRAALLAAGAMGAVVVACDTPVPTEVREAFEEVTADQRLALTEAEMERRSVRLRLLRDFVVTGRSRDAGPVVYLDGVRVPGPWETSDGEDPLSRLDPHDIATIEVLKGPAARELYGDEAASGVIEIFTKDAEPVPELVAVPSAGEFVVTEAVTGQQVAESELRLQVEGLVVTEQGRVEPVAEWQVEGLVVTEQGRVEPVAELQVEGLVVTGQALAEPVAEYEAEIDRLEADYQRALGDYERVLGEYQQQMTIGQARARRVAEQRAVELTREVKAQELVVTGQARARSVAELGVEGFVVTGPVRAVVYVDGVRVDEGGLDKVLRDIGGSDRIDRIEVEKGEAAEKLYGGEAAHGVIHIYTRR